MSGMQSSTVGGEGNLSLTERAISVALGLGIAAASVKRPNALGLVALLAGGALALRGATGYCPIKAAVAGGGGHEQLTYRS